MNAYYSKNEDCMKFTNEEIKRFIIEPMGQYEDIQILLNSQDQENITLDSNKRIKFLNFDGEKESFYIAFHDYLTAIFVLNEEFMFIDDFAKKGIPGCDTYKNVVFEGGLRDKSHSEILNIILRICLILKDAERISITEKIIVPETSDNYPVCDYVVDIFSRKMERQTIHCENITFRVNEP